MQKNVEDVHLLTLLIERLKNAKQNRKGQKSKKWRNNHFGSRKNTHLSAAFPNGSLSIDGILHIGVTLIDQLLASSLAGAVGEFGVNGWIKV